MTLEITAEREAYFRARGRVILNACPGSGKTTCVVNKLIELLKECHSTNGPYAGIACLSFTNKAKDEIQQKYRELTGESLHYPHSVSTIDRFINQFITLPFFNLLNSGFGRPKIIDNADIIEKALTVTFIGRNGAPQTTLRSPINRFKNRDDKAVYRSYPPGDIWIELDGSFSYAGKQASPDKVDPTVFQAYSQALFDWKVANGLITSSDAAFLGLKLLTANPKIGQWLIKRFPIIIIDEAQDNSAIQHALFDKLLEYGHSHMELIGDPYQSLYEWRDAKPGLFLDKYQDQQWLALPLSQNRRSIQRIVDCFSIVRLATDTAITSSVTVDLQIPVTIYRYHAANASHIVADFERICGQHQFTQNQIVVRGNELKDQMLGTSASIEPWKHQTPLQLLIIKSLFDSQHIKEAIDEVRKLIAQLSNPDYHVQRENLMTYKKDNGLNAQLYKFLRDLPGLDLSLEAWSQRAEAVLRGFVPDLGEAFLFKQRITGYVMRDLKQRPVKDFFHRASSRNANIPISTVHQVKGATLDALLYFFDEFSRGTSVSFNDFKPSDAFPTEKQRIIYVACSRPRQFLALAFPSRVTAAEIHARFGQQVFISPI
jgi:hypothetical protein